MFAAEAKRPSPARPSHVMATAAFAEWSIAVVPGPFAKRVAVGDQVSLESEPVTVRDPWLGRPRAALVDPYGAPTGPPSETLAQRKKKIAAAKTRLERLAGLEAAWAKTLGQPPAERIAIWRNYLALGGAAHTKLVERAIAELEQIIRESTPPDNYDEALALAEARTDTLSSLVGFDIDQELIHQEPSRVDEGTPLDLAFLVRAPQTIAKAWLYYRKAGDKSYLRVELAANGDSYLVGEVPADFIRPPGVEYFVELLDVPETGAADPVPRAVLYSDDSPKRVDVVAAPGPMPTDSRGRSRISTVFEFVDFDGVNSDFDQYWYGEVDFMYRFRKSWIYSLRLGFGTLNGTGGPKDVIDDDPSNSCLDAAGELRCEEVAYNYAYTELEWHYTNYFGITIRPQWGSAFRDDQMAGTPREFFDAFGLRGRLRFGREDGSNLLLGVSATQELGRLFEAAFTWDVVKKVPLVFSVHVTDQPVIEDVGVRLIADIGFRWFTDVYPSLRLAYQARDIDHAGFSGGLAINFDW